MKKILINSINSEETRIATLDNGKLIDLDIENVDREQKKANIYKAYISRIEPSLNAIFVNYGEDKNGFLPFKEVSEYYLKDTPNGDNIGHLLSEGQELIVQIDKEERGDKGAALTTFITLAGSYMVLLPNNPNGGGISRRVEGEDREKLKKYLKDLNIPKNMSVIARTACVECSFEELKHDFDNLVELWGSITHTYHKIKRAALLHKESDIIIRTVRDHLKNDVKEIIVDDKDCFNDVKRQLRLLRQGFDVNKVKLYSDDLPLFTQFSIDQQIENAYKREIRLPSGGSIVIDTTEALVAVDVNSSRANKAEDVETTAFKTNLEAAEEVARQLRIRDLGGLVIIDFIDMSFFPNRKQVEEKLMEALQQDKARIQMSKISKLGLVEISRQRLSASLNESVMQKCPRCEGHGFIKTTQATALTILRKIRAEAIKEDTNEIRVQVPVDIAAYILNEKRDSVIDIEKLTNVKVLIIPNFNMEAPKFQMQRIWGSSYKSNRTSPELIEDVYNVEIPKSGKKAVSAVDLSKKVEKNAIKHQATDTQEDNTPKAEKSNIEVNPVKTEKQGKKQDEKKGFFSKLAAAIFGSKEEDSKEVVSKKDENNHNAPKTNKPHKNFDKNKEQNNIGKKEHKNNSDKDANSNRNNKPNDSSDSNNTNDKNDKNDRPNNRDRGDQNRNKRNDKFEKKPFNKNQTNNRSSNINVNNAEEVIDITKLKYKSQVESAPVDNIKKVISKNPDEYVSVMVKDVLENYDSLKDDGSQKVRTEEKVRTHKYLKFDTVTVDEEIQSIEKAKKDALDAKKKAEEAAKAAEIEKQEEANSTVETEATPKKTASVKKEATRANTKPKAKKSAKKEEYISYSPAIDFESQSII